MYSGYPHRGLDAGLATGTPLVAPCDGVVVNFTNDGSFGKGVCINPGNGWYVLLAHNSSVLVFPGQPVKAGQLVALSGNTGMSTGPHCHLQISNSPTFPTNIGSSVDPRSMLEDNMPDPRVDAILETLRATGLTEWQSSGNEPIGRTLGKIHDQLAALNQKLDSAGGGSGMDSVKLQSAYETAMGLNALLMQWRMSFAVNGVVLP